jgi:putative membrane protein
MSAQPSPPGLDSVSGIERPHSGLMTYYLLACLLTGPLFPIVIIPAYFRYHTLRYRFDKDGISMRWGILFRREINLTYARIQDIHLTSNIIERWLGLARIQVQTASGSTSAEMTIEGLMQYELVRDFLYARMRGHQVFPARAGSEPSVSTGPGASIESSPAVSPALSDALVEVAEELRSVGSELRALRRQLADKDNG